MSIRGTMVGMTLLLVVLNSAQAEFQVNTYTEDNQRYASVAMHSDGSFVVVWASDDQDGDSSGVYGRRFDKDGHPLSDEFPLNSITAGSQSKPSISMDAAGNFWVAWSSPDSSETGIWARRFTNTGIPIGPESPVNTGTYGRQTDVSVSVRPDGAAAMAWRSNRSLTHTPDWHLQGRTFASDGTAASAEFEITNGQSPMSPKVSADSGGGFTVGYRGYDQGPFLRLRHYLANGTAPALPYTAVAGVSFLDLARDNAGNRALAYSYSDGDPIAKTDMYITVQDANGGTLVPEFRANAHRSGNQAGLIAMNASGQMLAVMASPHEDEQDPLSGDNDIYYRAFDSDGTPLSPEIKLNQWQQWTCSTVRTAMNDDGRFVVIWTTRLQDGDGYGVFATVGSIWDENLYPLPGDANRDNKVDLDDFVILKQHFLQSPAGWNCGDFDDDDDVDMDDFVILKQNFLTVRETPGTIEGEVYYDNNGNGIRDYSLPGANPLILLAMDMTSTVYNADLDSVEDDFVFDGTEATTVFEAQLACLKAFSQEIVDQDYGTMFDIAVTPYFSWMTFKDMDLQTGGTQNAIQANTDADDDGVLDVHQVLDLVEPFGTVNEYENVLMSLNQTLSLQGMDDYDDLLLVFLGDGSNEDMTSVLPGVSVLESRGVTLHAFGVGCNSVYDDPGTTVADLAAVGAGSKITTTDEMVDALMPVVRSYLVSEVGVAGWTVYADVNGNGVLDASEPRAVTAADGTFSLSAAPGTYDVRIVPQPRWSQTDPGAEGVHVVTVVSDESSDPIEFGVTW